MQVNGKTVHLTDAEKQLFQDNKAKAEESGLSPTQAARVAKIAKNGRTGFVDTDGSVKDEAYGIHS